MATIYRRGSMGPEVLKIQQRLRELNYYAGPLDGDFGGGTEAAVKDFQRGASLSADGKVGPKTWAALFEGEEPARPEIAGQSLDHRCLALTGSFETSSPVPECFAGLSGDFDGQGISFGALQWNLGQGSLQPLLKEMNEKHQTLLKDIFDENHPVLVQVLEESLEEQLNWARSIQHPGRHYLYEPWRGLFKTPGRREEFKKIQVEHAAGMFRVARGWFQRFGVRSERALALLFDIMVQNGSISRWVEEQILGEFETLQMAGELDEVARLKIIANRRAEASNPRWVEDVRRRKLAIAEGVGTVHGRRYRLEEQYGIGLADAYA